MAHVSCIFFCEEKLQPAGFLADSVTKVTFDKSSHLGTFWRHSLGQVMVYYMLDLCVLTS